MFFTVQDRTTAGAAVRGQWSTRVLRTKLRYRPPLKASTALLWRGPALLLATGLRLLWRGLRRPPEALGPREPAQLDALFDGRFDGPPGVLAADRMDSPGVVHRSAAPDVSAPTPR
jgi:hypothetical protein